MANDGKTLRDRVVAIPLSRPRAVGVVAVRNCVFDRCRLTHVGIAGPPDFISQFRATARET